MWLQSDKVSCLKTSINTIVSTFADIQEFSLGCLFLSIKIMLQDYTNVCYSKNQGISTITANNEVSEKYKFSGT